MFRLETLRMGLKLECAGMERNGKSAYSIIKHEFGLKGSRVSVYAQFCELIEREKGRLGDENS